MGFCVLFLFPPHYLKREKPKKMHVRMPLRFVLLIFQQGSLPFCSRLLILASCMYCSEQP